MPKIEKIGGFLKKDSSGYLVNPCSLEKIQQPWRSAVQELQKTLISQLSDQIHSLYLRGTLPRGEAREGISDVDVILVLNDKPENMDLSWAPKTQWILKKKYPFANYFELNIISLKDLLEARGYYSYRFVIKNLSACLYGINLIPNLPPAKPCIQVAFFLYGNFRDVLSKSKERIKLETNPEKIQRVCQWVMKRILRTGFGLIMEKEEAFTRDLYPCYESFIKYFPKKNEAMKQALEWAINPISDKIILLDFLENFGVWLLRESGRVFAGKNG